MATPEQKLGAAAPAADDGVLVDGESLSREVPGADNPVSSQADSPDKQPEEQGKEAEKGSEKGKPDVKSTIIISGAVVAVVGAILALAPKVAAIFTKGKKNED